MFLTFDYTITFQAVKMVIMYTPDPEHRKNSFAVLKGVSFLCYTMPFKLEVFFIV